MEKTLEQHKSNCLKVVLFGPECTGKTTLSKALANHYNTVWVAEYSRTYLQKKWDNEHKICEPKDMLSIAYGQMREENKLEKEANEILFCDTNLLELKVYSEVYYNGFCEPLLNSFALKNNYTLYLLTSTDIPWVLDDLRDKPNEREKMFHIFEKTLITHNKPYIVLEGNKEIRLQKAIKHIDYLLIELRKK